MLVCAGAASVLAAVSVAGAAARDDTGLLAFCAVWWTGAGAVAFAFPQVPAVAAGFAIIWALYWRRQDGAVTAVEERDGVAFHVERTSPVRPMQLVRTPGFRRAES